MIRLIRHHLVFCSKLFGHEWKIFFQSRVHACAVGIFISVLFAQINFANAQTPQISPDGSTVPTTVEPKPAIAAVMSLAGQPTNATDKKPDAADAKSASASAEPKEKIINNPFVPGGVVTSNQVMTRKEVEAMMLQQEERLRKEMTGQSMSSDEISKLISNAAAPATNTKPDNFMGCVNGVPIYRQIDGTLDLGTKDPEPIRQERCSQ